MNTAAEKARDRLRRALMSHAEVSRRTELMPAREGVGAYVQTWVTTACGIEVGSTSATRTPERATCPDCRP